MSKNLKPTIAKQLVSAAILATTINAGIPTPAFGKKPTEDTPATEPPPAEEPKLLKLPKLKFTKQTVKLADLVFSHKVQARDHIDKEALADYTEKAKEAKAKGADSPFPPLKAVKRGDEILIFSGFTRGAALKKAEYDETAVEVAVSETITDADLFRLAVEANAEHGVRLTNADKLHNLLRALKFPEYAELTNNALGAVVGCSEFFIRQHRPVSATPVKRKTKSGKTVTTGRIGKKGGKAPAKKKATAAATGGGTVDEPDLDGTAGESKKGTTPAVDDETSRALTRVATVLDGYAGFTSKGFREGVEQGTIKVSGADLKTWAQTSDSRVKLIAPLVVNLGWTPKKAFAHLDKEVTSATKLDHLINSAITTGGVLKRNGTEIGERITDNETYSVVVFDSTKFKVTVTPVK